MMTKIKSLSPEQCEQRNSYGFRLPLFLSNKLFYLE